MTAVRYISCVIAFLAVPHGADAKVVTSTDTEYYEILGLTASALRKEMTKRGVRNDNSKRRFSGGINYHKNWSFEFTEKSGECRIKSVWVKIWVTLTLPKWINKADAPLPLQKSWDVSLAALIAHEEQHAQIAFDAGVLIEDVIWRTKPHWSCGEVENAAYAAASDVWQRHRELNREFDKKTENGRLQIPKLHD